MFKSFDKPVHSIVWLYINSEYHQQCVQWPRVARLRWRYHSEASEHVIRSRGQNQNWKTAETDSDWWLSHPF